MRAEIASVVLIPLLLISTLAGCANPTTSKPTQSLLPGSVDTLKEQRAEELNETSARLKVVTTISIIADMIHQVGQDRVTVKSIIPAGAEPHTFQPTPQDVREISESDIAFINGMGLEGQIEKLVRAAGADKVRLVVLSDGLQIQAAEQRSENDADEHTEGNPHLWLDVRNGMGYVNRIQRELSAADPDGASIYAHNAEKYLAELAELDSWIEQQINTIPKDNRKLVTFHDAFPYYANRYGLQIVGVVIRSPGQEPSAKEVAELVEKIRREKVRTVFAEPQMNTRVLEIVAKEAGVKIATLYSDSTDRKINGYTALMRYNTEQIVNGLR